MLKHRNINSFCWYVTDAICFTSVYHTNMIRLSTTSRRSLIHHTPLVRQTEIMGPYPFFHKPVYLLLIFKFSLVCFGFLYSFTQPLRPSQAYNIKMFYLRYHRFFLLREMRFQCLDVDKLNNLYSYQYSDIFWSIN